MYLTTLGLAISSGAGGNKWQAAIMQKVLGQGSHCCPWHLPLTPWDTLWTLFTGTGQAEAYPHCMAGADGGGVGWNWLPMQVHVTPGLTGALFLSIQCRVEGQADRVGEKHGVGKVDLRVWTIIGFFHTLFYPTLGGGCLVLPRCSGKWGQRGGQVRSSHKR